MTYISQLICSCSSTSPGSRPLTSAQSWTEVLFLAEAKADVFPNVHYNNVSSPMLRLRGTLTKQSPLLHQVALRHFRDRGSLHLTIEPLDQENEGVFQLTLTRHEAKNAIGTVEPSFWVCSVHRCTLMLHPETIYETLKVANMSCCADDFRQTTSERIVGGD